MLLNKPKPDHVIARSLHSMMRASALAVLLSQGCAAFFLSPATRTVSRSSLSPLQSAAAEGVRVLAREQIGGSSTNTDTSSTTVRGSGSIGSSGLSTPSRRRQRLPGGYRGSRVPGFTLGAAKDWLKGGSQGRGGPEGLNGRPAPSVPGSSNAAGSTGAKSSQQGGISGKDAKAGGEEQDPRLYSVRIGRSTGIEWGTDISFAWVYVRALQPDGAAANCGEVSVGDQLIAINDKTLTGAPFDVAMDAMIALEGPEVEFTFFRGTTDELKEVVGAERPPAQITVTVKQEGKPDLDLKAPSGSNLRDFLTENGINVYQSVTRWTNCKGKQLCGTCIVEINEGLENTTIRSIDESTVLRDNPSNYRLSCVTNMYDDVTVTVFPPVGAAQWTR